MSRTIFHITRQQDWDDALRAGAYRVSTLGRTLDEEGFIHCSASASQGVGVANSFYRNVSEPLVVLTIATARLVAEVRDEVPEGATEAFPHIFGPIAIDAVIRIDALARDDTGRFVWPRERGS